MDFLLLDKEPFEVVQKPSGHLPHKIVGGAFDQKETESWHSWEILSLSWWRLERLDLSQREEAEEREMSTQPVGNDWR